MPKIDLTVVCEGGGMTDFKHQLHFMGKKGMILCFLERENADYEDYLDSRSVEEFLL